MESIRAVTWKGQHEEQVRPKCFSSPQADHGFFWHSVQKCIPPGVYCAMCSPWHVAPHLNKINFCKWQLINSGEHSRLTLSQAHLEKPGNHRLPSSNPQTSCLLLLTKADLFLSFKASIKLPANHRHPCPRDVELDQIQGIWKMHSGHGPLVKAKTHAKVTSYNTSERDFIYSGGWE